jgi:hypothetical protein
VIGCGRCADHRVVLRCDSAALGWEVTCGAGHRWRASPSAVITFELTNPLVLDWGPLPPQPPTEPTLPPGTAR